MIQATVKKVIAQGIKNFAEDHSVGMEQSRIRIVPTDFDDFDFKYQSVIHGKEAVDVPFSKIDRRVIQIVPTEQLAKPFIQKVLAKLFEEEKESSEISVMLFLRDNDLKIALYGGKNGKEFRRYIAMKEIF